MPSASPLLLLLGPCSLENIDTCRAVADVLAVQRDRFPEAKIIFKGSFDKANRTSVTSPRGPGLEDGLELLATIKREYGFPVVTDIHLPEQAAPVAEVCDVLQIPAFLCRQTDLLVAAAQTGRIVNVKKGQFLSPFEMEFVVRKLEASFEVATSGSQGVGKSDDLQTPGHPDLQTSRIWQTDRGTTFGYQNLVVDVRSYPIMAQFGHPTICDATHAVQLPGAAGGKSGGQREFVETIAKAALAAGANGLFMETHPDPANALSDQGSQIPLDRTPQGP